MEQLSSPPPPGTSSGTLTWPEAQIGASRRSRAGNSPGLRRRRRGAATASAVAVIFLSGCASSRGPTGERLDPWESVNRAVFDFNVTVDDYTLGPVARGYRWAVPEPVRNSLSRFFDNAAFPKRFVANLGQGRGGPAAEELARFAVNTTAGVGGLFDPAGWLGLEPAEEDIGQMLGAWGVPDGPYVVLPLLGPSNPRDATGRAVEILLNPFTYIGQFVSSAAGGATGGVSLLHTRAEVEEDLTALREAALDYYISSRDAYLDRREQQVGNRAASLEEPAAVPEEIYDLEEEEGAEEVSPQSGAADAVSP